MAERSDINNLQMQLSIPMRMVTGCINQHGMTLTLALLKRAETQFNLEKKRGRKISSAGTIFKNCIQRQLSTVKANAQLEQVNEWRRIRDAEHDAGFRPTPEKLRSMIEELYGNGEISIQEYEWGCKGDDLVAGIVADAQEE